MTWMLKIDHHLCIRSKFQLILMWLECVCMPVDSVVVVDVAHKCSMTSTFFSQLYFFFIIHWLEVRLVVFLLLLLLIFSWLFHSMMCVRWLCPHFQLATRHFEPLYVKLKREHTHTATWINSSFRLAWPLEAFNHWEVVIECESNVHDTSSSALNV